jgi:response regulator RpfG family c-di-GMP phosphodiesterase
MAEVKFDDIRLFLCDPRVQVRSSLRMALNDAGMKNGNIWEGGDLEAITNSVSDPNGPDIVICDVTENTDDACQIFSAIRHNELGTNPFICIIGVAWSPKQALVNKVMGSGADVLVAAPISPSLILDRIEALVHSRKPFVVTSDYIGPDRRFLDDRGNEIELVELKKVTNDMKMRAFSAGSKDLEELCVPLRTVVQSLIDSRGKFTKKDLNLLGQLSLAVRAAVRPGVAGSVSARDITNMVVGAGAQG